MKKRYSIFRIVFLSTVSICLIFVLTYLSKSEKKFFNFIVSLVYISGIILKKLYTKEWR